MLCGVHVTLPRAGAAGQSRPCRASARQAPCVGGPGCTSERQSTHNTDVREVRYRWHPWYRRQVRVQAARGRKGLPVVRCTPLDGPRFPGLEIPHWMFDPEVSGTGEVVDAAHVDLEALRVLAALLTDSQCRPDLDVVDRQHPPFTQGDADANAIAGPAVGAVPADLPHSGDATRRLPHDGAVAGPPAARACSPGRARPGRTGGGA